MANLLSGKQTILAVMPGAEDRVLLKNIFAGSDYRLRFLRSFPRKRTASRLECVGAVLTDVQLADNSSWKDVLHEMERISNPPPLIVASRLADEALWAEVLNLGGHDVLAKPFDRKEVVHAVTTACIFRRKRASSFSPQAKVRWSVA